MCVKALPSSRHLVGAQLCMWSLADQVAPLRTVFQRAQIDFHWFICVLLPSPFVSNDALNSLGIKDFWVAQGWLWLEGAAECHAILIRRLCSWGGQLREV